MFNVKDLKFHYKGGPRVLKSVSFSLEDGRMLAILGNNGAGKSTMLKCFNKIITPDEGSISIDDTEILDLPVREVAKKIAFVAQSVPETRMTVHDMVTLGRRPYMKWGFTAEDHEIVHDAMDSMGLLHMRGRYLNELSGGEVQKTALARALAQQPKLLLLDEPTSNLDLNNQYQVLQIVKNLCETKGITAIVVIHDLNLALRFCDRFLLLQSGQVYDFGERDILTRKALLDVYGVHGKVAEVEEKKIVLVD